MADSRSTTCCICGSEQSRRLYPLPDLTLSPTYVFECSNCGVRFLHPRPGLDELKDTYSNEHYPAMGIADENKSGVTRRIKCATFEKRLKDIKEFFNNCSEKPRLLDLGCATGYLLEVAAGEGWDCYGVELSRMASRIAQEKIGKERVFCGLLEEMIYPEEFFDVICMLDFLEHTEDPNRVLSRSARILRRGGLIFIVTPDIHSISAHLMNKRWTHYKLEHFYYFQKKTIEYLANKHNLNILRSRKAVKIMALEYIYFHFRQYEQSLLSKLVARLYFLSPGKIRKMLFPISMGEREYILSKRM